MYLRSTIQNYYTANNAPTIIGTTESIPEELKRIVIEASAATSKIVEYVNNHKEEFE